LNHLDVQVKPEERTQAAGECQVVSLAEVCPADPEPWRSRRRR
jgi:hypothetical protein